MGKLATPDWIREGFDSKEAYEKKKGIKTKKAAAKRFKITASGKVMRSSAGRRHLCQTKSAKRRRNLRGTTTVHSTDEYRIKQGLMFSH